MNPTDLRWNITPIVVTVLGLLLALFLGVFIGGSETTNLGVIFGLVGLVAIVSSMRQHIWLLLPMFWGFTGYVTLLPIPFSVRDLVVMLVAAVSCALFALKVFKFQNRWDFLDWVLLLTLGQVCLAFIFNPVGLKVFSSETVGARPYFNVAIGAVAYFILSNQVISPKLAQRLPIFIVIAELSSAFLYLIARASSSIGAVLGKFYDGFAPPDYRVGLAPTIDRMTGVVSGGTSLITALCSYFRPLTLINPLRFGRWFLFLIGLVLILISGFRSQLLTIAVIFLLASYFRHGWSDVAISLAGLFSGAALLIFFNMFVYPLPLSMQRTLSALPGHWDSRAVRDATGSTEWRLEMWKDIPKGTRYIKNRIMGDGFGFSRAELSAMERQKFLSGDISPEDFMIIGSFHNGPLSAIRFVGFVGLALYYTLLIYLAVYAWRLIRITRGSMFFTLALFVGLEVIWEPFSYTLVFGAFDSGFPNALFNAGMLKMIYNSIEQNVAPQKRDLKPALHLPLLERSKAGTV
jgi:hypothetical protein